MNVFINTIIHWISVILDTPMNRKAMPQADFSSWTPLNVLAEYVDLC
jgi:hypothetical protein